MKICVIGGTGNISSSIVSQLIKRGHDVYCFNRGLSGKVPKEVHQITGDRNDEKSFEKTIQDEFFDYESGIFALDGEMQCPECKTDLPV